MAKKDEKRKRQSPIEKSLQQLHSLEECIVQGTFQNVTCTMFRLEYRDNQCLRSHHLHLPVLISNVTLPASFFAHFRNKHLIISFLSSRAGNEQIVISIMCTFK